MHDPLIGLIQSYTNGLKLDTNRIVLNPQWASVAQWEDQELQYRFRHSLKFFLSFQLQEHFFSNSIINLCFFFIYALYLKLRLEPSKPNVEIGCAWQNVQAEKYNRNARPKINISKIRIWFQENKFWGRLKASKELRLFWISRKQFAVNAKIFLKEGLKNFISWNHILIFGMFIFDPAFLLYFLWLSGATGFCTSKSEVRVTLLFL